MVFNSYEFFLFLPIVYCLYWFLLNKSLIAQNFLILASSYFFYGWFSKKFLLLLILVTVLDYFYGFFVASRNKKRAKFFLILSVINNIGVLAIFKYYDFFAKQFQVGFSNIGINIEPVFLDLALPIGISFYTFHGMSYVFDIYRNKQKPIMNIVDYSVFVGFFPLLVAGPIERASHLLPQIQKPRSFDYLQSVEGCRLIIWGLFKKVVVADSIAVYVNAVFGDYANLNAVDLIIGIIAFSFQIYCDFSGYSDIAMGVSKLFGFELLSNFKFPYFSRNVAEFWRRWHISLSSWFRDYLYIPLGGSKKGTVRAILNIFIIFLVSGFWHGASWNYIIWGFAHACGFLPFFILKKNRESISEVVAHNNRFPSLRELFQMMSTFIFVSFAWIFFRSDSVSAALGYIERIVESCFENQIQFFQYSYKLVVFVYILPLLIGDWFFRRDERRLRRWSGLISIILCVLIWFHFNSKSTFIYFQF